jgi:NTE family protein
MTIPGKHLRLALSGSGFLAGIHAGAVCAFLESGIEIVEIAATSGGSIVGIAVALGYGAVELHELAVDTPMDGLLTRNYLRAAVMGSCDSGASLYSWLDKAFAGRKMRDAHIPIQVISTDLANGAFVFSPPATPDVPMALAARASAAVPKVWDPVRYEGRYLFDGGMCANIPVDYLTSDGIARLGVKVMEADSYDVSTRLARDEAMIARLIESNEQTEMHLGTALGIGILKVDAGSVGFLEVPTTAVRQALFNSGHYAAKQYLAA